MQIEVECRVYLVYSHCVTKSHNIWFLVRKPWIDLFIAAVTSWTISTKYLILETTLGDRHANGTTVCDDCRNNYCYYY